MTPHIARPGDCCGTCQRLAWGGERYITGKLGVHCLECWDRDWERVGLAIKDATLSGPQYVINEPARDWPERGANE